jgi:hypothetical protein
MPLTILTDAEVQAYVASLDLSPGTEASRTMSAMLLLPASTFARLVSALQGGLVTLSNVRALPAMNAALVDAMINSRLGEDDGDVLAYRYRNEWFPSSIDVVALRTASMGPQSAQLATKFTTRWDLMVRPRYDYTATDETAFHSYAEAFVAYMVAANDSVCLDAVAAFRADHATFALAHPGLLDGSGPVLPLVERLLTEVLFLERPRGGLAAEPLLDYVLSARFRHVSPVGFASFMTEAFAAMAASTDPARTGEPGMEALRSAIPWAAIPALDTGASLSRPRMARVHLPEAYGEDVSADSAIEGDVVAYFESALLALLAVQARVAELMKNSAVSYRAVPGSPVGLLLALTLP